MQVFTDSSDTAWGIVHNNHYYSGKWNKEEIQHHINFKELLVITKIFSHILISPHQHLQLCIDNTSAIAYINKYGGTRSTPLNQLAMSIWDHCFRHHIHLTTLYVPSQFNPADAPSRNMLQQNDWSITPTAYQQLDHLWGPHYADLFASPSNTKIPHRFATWHYHPAATWTNALSLNWSKLPGRLYLCPPWNLISKIVLKLTHQPQSATLITPTWPSAPWWPLLLNMTTSPAITLPPQSVQHVNDLQTPLTSNPHWTLSAWNIDQNILDSQMQL
jgi:hypothetical protein